MHYVNFVYEESGESNMYAGPVAESDAAYLQLAVEHLQPLSDEEYMTGPAVILHTMAKYSYVLDGQQLYWCTEWDPGPLVVSMKPGEELQWVALRSPIPDFGGRVPLPDDDPDYDEDHNPQYNLIFSAWDAQFDEQDREWGSFVPADKDIQQRFENALARVNGLGDIMQSRYSADAQAWLEMCKRNLQEWASVGIRLKPRN